MAKTALLFPGQGAPAARWADAVRELRPDLIELGSELLGDDPFERLGESTEYDQVAICCTSLLAYERLEGEDADYHAGHSLGEIPALVCAGALTDEEGVRVVAARGPAMAEAARRSDAGGMLAVGADANALRGPARKHELTIANENSPEQTVLSGPADALGEMETELRDRGIRAKRLEVGAAFHSPVMEDAVEAFRAALAEVEFRRPRVPVLSCVSVRPFAHPAGELAAALTSRVRWVEVMRWLQSHGARRFVEVGPGKALSGLARRTLPEAETEQVPVPEAVAHG